tara:strand:+ start:4022 stop:5032 length:1011 start_codon:yes stop_codon:yes gene_type:complete
MIYFSLIYILFMVSIAIYLKKHKYLSNFSGDNHQLFSNKKDIPLVGGILLFIPLILLNFQNFFLIAAITFITLIGLLSDRKILASPKKRFLFQLAFVITSVISLDLEIITSRIDFFDDLLKINIFNIIFTSFCLLILINGSNFIDGLNGLLSIYMIMVLLVIFNLELIPQNNIDKNLFINFIFLFVILTILNLFNLLMLGDTGAYLISFFAGYLIITCHKLNPNISPYFFITLIWYPCYENLFSIIRKLKSKFSPLTPDNNHLHQLFYKLIKKKLFNNKLFANNTSSILINLSNLVIILFSLKDPYNTVYQIKLITGSTIFYTIFFMFLKNKINSL